MSTAKSLKNPNPVVMSPRKVQQVSDQLRGFAFCNDCEQMLSRKGERWVLANIPTDQGNPFPLQDALVAETPVLYAQDLNVYAGRKITAFDMDQLIYFGMSIFWRAAVREWKTTLGAVAPPVDLREYCEPIRQFLLGGPFPDDVAILIYVHNLKPAPNAATTVLPGKDHTRRFYWFYLSGLGFKLYLGKKTPQQIRQLCAVHSADGFVLVDAEFGKMVRAFLKDYLTSQELSPKLREFLKLPNGTTNLDRLRTTLDPQKGRAQPVRRDWLLVARVAGILAAVKERLRNNV